MSPGGWQVLILAGSAVIIAGMVVYAARLDGNGGHTHRNAPRRDADPFADPADRDDPDGVSFIARISADNQPHPDLDALTPFPVGTGSLEALPDDDPPEVTGVQSVEVCYVGTTNEQYVDDLFPVGGGELFDEHAGAQQ